MPAAVFGALVICAGSPLTACEFGALPFMPAPSSSGGSEAEAGSSSGETDSAETPEAATEERDLSARVRPAAEAARELAEIAPSAYEDERVFPGVRPTPPPEPMVSVQQAGMQGDRSADDVDYIVKIKNADLKSAVLDVFRKDKEAARVAFRTWAAANGLAGFELVGATYSGEVIIHIGDGAPAEVRKRASSMSARDMAAEISARPDVVYCDPDYTARPG